MYQSPTPLIIGTIAIAFLHALLGPDHYLPFIMISRARNWTKSKLLFITLFAGLGHVGSSIALGIAGILLGFGLNNLQSLESSRGGIAVLLLIGFGLGYAVWGLVHSRNHHHHHGEELNDKKIITLWTAFAVFVLGPCEPLIPLLFAATAFGWHMVVLISAIFSIITIFMMMTLSYLGVKGLDLVKIHFLEKYSHALAGLVIVLTGVFLLV
jgi:nickel/cobalt transporter (NicO) family protein